MARELEPIYRYSCDICAKVFESISQDVARNNVFACEAKGTPRAHAFKIGAEVFWVNDSGLNKHGKIVGLFFAETHHTPFYTVWPDEFGDNIKLQADKVYKTVNGVSS